MVRKKTGGLFRLAFRLMHVFSTNAGSESSDYAKLIDQLGLYFQIRDDYINLTR
jgi:geranylgeranyl diphosphate synthase type 3